jgi:hypothetical protein
MEKEFIPYKQALALKELGFDEPCISKWEEDYLCQDEGFDICNDDTWLTNTKLHYNKKYCTAPLYQQAFRWFREKYNLHPLIEQTQVDYRCSIVEKPIIFYHIDNIFETYEEAELECLKKLIEIIKEKK